MNANPHTPAARPYRQRAAGFLLALCLAALSGCGAPVVQLTGKVTQGQRPLPGADVHFVCKDRSPEIFIGGITGPDGGLQLDTGRTGGVPVGPYKITVSWWVRARTGAPLPAGEEGESLKGTEAARQNVVTFDREITRETTSLDLDVTKGQRQPTG